MAEFNALRAEIIQLNTAQAAFVGISVTALGVILGLGLSKDGDERLLLTIPPLGIVVTLVYAGYAYRASSIGGYIRTELWPYLCSRVGHLPSWEATVNAQRRSRRGIFKAITDAPAPVLFLVSSLVILVFESDGKMDGRDVSELETLGWVSCGVVALLLLAAAVTTRMRAARAESSTFCATKDASTGRAER